MVIFMDEKYAKNAGVIFGHILLYAHIFRAKMPCYEVEYKHAE